MSSIKLLFLDENYLAIASLSGKIPDEKTYALLKGRIKLLINNYEKDFEDFLNIEIDIEIEEARKLHRIDHYITFLKMVSGFEELINRLNDLKKKAEYWVYQDVIDAKKLIKYAKSLDYGLSALKASEALNDNFPGVVVVNSPIENFVPGHFVPGLLIYNKNKPKPNRAVVMMHGAFQSKEAFITLGKRLALLDFWVYSIDITSHGESREKVHLGRSCEYIEAAVRWFKLKGISNVGIVGYSLGAVITLFYICGYNMRVENEFYKLVTRTTENLALVMENMKGLGHDVKGLGHDALNNALAISEDYQNLKILVANAMKKRYEGLGRINAAVLLSAPLTIQFVFPVAASKIVKRLPKFMHRGVGKGINTLFNKLARDQEGKNTLQYKPMAKKGEVQVMSVVHSDVYYTYNYAQTVKNPYDFINLVNYFSEGIEMDKEISFFKYYRNIIRRTPKLFVYGLADKLLKPLKKNNMPELEAHYKDMGETEVVRYPNVRHRLSKEGKDHQLEAGKLPKLTYKILTFLNNYMGRGRLI